MAGGRSAADIVEQTAGTAEWRICVGDAAQAQSRSHCLSLVDKEVCRSARALFICTTG